MLCRDYRGDRGTEGQHARAEVRPPSDNNCRGSYPSPVLSSEKQEHSEGVPALDVPCPACSDRVSGFALPVAFPQIMYPQNDLLRLLLFLGIIHFSNIHRHASLE